jgi:ArsR family transcriptional regulator, arsenate/arsenite/antimonite-responsive transcriptional repressor
MLEKVQEKQCSKLSADEIEELGIFLKAMSHPTRLWILQFLADQDCCISGEIADELPIARSTVSEHLRQLKLAGLIQGEIEHPKIKYCINKQNWNRVKELTDLLFNQLSNSDNQLFCK